MRIYNCPCGQTSTDDSRDDERHLMIECPRVCDVCRSAALEPQGEAVRLFEPAPTQMAGQMTL